MRLNLLLVIFASFTLVTLVSAQSNSGWTPFTPTTRTPVHAATPAAPSSSASTSPSAPAPAAAPVLAGESEGSGSNEMTNADFQIDGVPYAKALYMEGNVWIRPPGDTTFHKLDADEPIANLSVIHTGYNGVLDFATGPGMALRMVPNTVLVVKALPEPAAESSTTPAVSQVNLRNGTVFSALGCENGAPIDYTVQTPMGTAAARGTMFATSATGGSAQVSMLHGTVNFTTPDHQTSQIAAGQSQQISGVAGEKYQIARQKAFNPDDSEAFFNHAAGLLEHASGYGVVRRGLGPDVAKEMVKHGYKLPAVTTQRFQNAGKLRFKTRPVFNRTKAPVVKPVVTNPNTKRTDVPVYHPPVPAENVKPVPRYPPPQDPAWKDKDRNLGQ